MSELDDFVTWVKSNEAPSFGRSVAEVAGLYRASLPGPVVAIVNADGWLQCPVEGCESVQFNEIGSHPCDWAFEDQEPETKTLILRGEFEWYDGSGDGFTCSAGHYIDALPEGWTTDYAG